MLRQLMLSLTEHGWVQPVVCRRSDNMIIAGHQRVAASDELRSWVYNVDKQEWQKRKKPESKDKVMIPVFYVDNIDDAAAKALNLKLNKIQGDWDYEKLTDLLSDLQLQNVQVPTGFTAAEIDELLSNKVTTTADLAAALPMPTHTNGTAAVPTQQLPGQRVSSFKLTEADSVELDTILARFGCKERKERGDVLMNILRYAVKQLEDAQDKGDDGWRGDPPPPPSKETNHADDDETS